MVLNAQFPTFMLFSIVAPLWFPLLRHGQFSAVMHIPKGFLKLSTPRGTRTIPSIPSSSSFQATISGSGLAEERAAMERRRKTRGTKLDMILERKLCRM
ncbi:hypothetical protein PENTCL1PPCAC_2777, partial [Pristionchus entomophagus]